MLRWLALALLLLAPAAQACDPEDPMDASASITMDFALPEGCTAVVLDPCHKLPEADVPLVLDGVLTWTSELDAACSLGAPSAGPVTINLRGLVRDQAGWLDLRAEPSEIVIPVTDQYDLTDDAVEPGGGRVRSQESYPIQAIVSLVGEPSPEALEGLRTSQGGVRLLLRAEMGATAAFAVAYDHQAFPLDGRAALEASDDASRDVPSVPALVPLVALLGLALLARRAA